MAMLRQRLDRVARQLQREAAARREEKAAARDSVCYPPLPPRSPVPADPKKRTTPPASRRCPAADRGASRLCLPWPRCREKE